MDVVDVDTASEDARWRQWKAKGRADDLRFRRSMRTVLISGAGVALVAVLWFAFSM
jgi:hypothetical protein